MADTGAEATRSRRFALGSPLDRARAAFEPQHPLDPFVARLGRERIAGARLAGDTLIGHG
jgi:hypothetical protein